MSRIAPIDPAAADSHAKPLLDAVKAKLGMVPNLMRTLAVAPAALEGYLSLNGALAKGKLNAATRERVALAVAQQNRCGYCLSAHTLLGKMAGLNEGEIKAARSGESSDAKANAIVQLAVAITQKRGHLTPADLDAARSQGVTDAEITETVAHVAVNVLTNYFNSVAETAIDFPPVEV